MSKDRPEDALRTLATYHAGGDINNSTVQFEYREIKETIKLEAVARATTGYMDFFRTKGNRWRLAIIVSLGVISQYSGNALFSNYMNTVYEGAGIKDQDQKLAVSSCVPLSVVITLTHPAIRRQNDSRSHRHNRSRHERRPFRSTTPLPRFRGRHGLLLYTLDHLWCRLREQQ